MNFVDHRLVLRDLRLFINRHRFFRNFFHQLGLRLRLWYFLFHGLWLRRRRWWWWQFALFHKPRHPIRQLGFFLHDLERDDNHADQKNECYCSSNRAAQ